VAASSSRGWYEKGRDSGPECLQITLVAFPRNQISLIISTYYDHCPAAASGNAALMSDRCPKHARRRVSPTDHVSSSHRRIDISVQVQIGGPP